MYLLRRVSIPAGMPYASKACKTSFLKKALSTAISVLSLLIAVISQRFLKKVSVRMSVYAVT